MAATAQSRAPFCPMVAVPLPSAPLPASCTLGKLVRADGTAVAQNVTALCAIADDAVTPLTPAAFGSRTYVDACPLASVTAAAALTCAPIDAWNATGAPTTGAPDESSRAIWNGTGRSAPGAPVWLLPLTCVICTRLLSKPLIVRVPVAAAELLVSTAWMVT